MSDNPTAPDWDEGNTQMWVGKPAPQSADLVERLRRGIAIDGGRRTLTKVPIFDEAADEIELLRAEVESLKRAFLTGKRPV